MIDLIRILWSIGMFSTCIYQIELGNFGKCFLYLLAGFIPFTGNILKEIKSLF